MTNCVCEHSYRSHYNDGHCGLCACNLYRRLLECAQCCAVICVDTGLADDEGALCGACGRGL